MDQILSIIAAHPKIMAAMLAVLLLHNALKGFVDSIQAHRPKWDKTPTQDETVAEKVLTAASRFLTVTADTVKYLLAGIRPQQK